MEKWQLDMVFIKDKQEKNIAREKLSEFGFNFHWLQFKKKDLMCNLSRFYIKTKKNCALGP